MKRTISAAGKPIFFIKKLTKQFIQRNLPCCKNTQVPVHGEKVVGGTDSQCRSNRYRFLSDDGEPFTYYILSEQIKHSLIYRSQMEGAGGSGQGIIRRIYFFR